ncbi:hypothetical protein FQR65_LT08166 [Abscondita terminalis]|nr:hypothetical protein FQR65_LT08166 [Abscondita terminalis]
MEFEDIFEDDLDVLEIIEFGFPRQIYLRNNPHEDLNELTFFRRIRIFKRAAQHILTLIQHELEYPHNLCLEKTLSHHWVWISFKIRHCFNHHCVLHNVAIEMNEPEPPPPERMDINELNYLIEIGQIQDAI